MAEAKTALIVIDAQHEYFAPTGKVVLPGGETILAEQVHKTHLGSVSGFPAEVKSVKDIAT